MEVLDWTLPSGQGDFSSGVWIGSDPSLADPFCLSRLKPEKVPTVWGFRKGGATAFSRSG